MNDGRLSNQYRMRLRRAHGHDNPSLIPLTFILSPIWGEEVTFTIPLPVRGEGQGEGDFQSNNDVKVFCCIRFSTRSRRHGEDAADI